jgi:glutamyl-tRNA reductase
LAVAEDELAAVLGRLREAGGLHEVMVVSTCNRVEIYGVHSEVAVASDRLIEQFASLRSVEYAELRGHTFTRVSRDAARHIFRVAASLESLVVGEPQILGQVKNAFFRAKEIGVVGPVLDRCLSLAFKSAKRVRSETGIARGGASVPSVAVDLAASIFGDLRRCPVAIIGAGEMAEQAGIHLRAAGANDIVVVNRSPERGRDLAHEVGGRYEGWEGLEQQLVRADVVVTSTGSQRPIIDRPMLRSVMKKRRHRPVFMVDIAVPRDIDARAGDLEHVFLYNVDDLQAIVAENLRNRTDEADRAGEVVEEEVQAFVGWLHTRSVGPLIGELQKYGREVVEREIEKVLRKFPNASEAERAAIEQLGRSIAQKLLHRPMASVRQASATATGRFDGPALAEALSALYQLDSTTQSPEPSPAESSESAPLPEPSKVPRPELS